MPPITRREQHELDELLGDIYKGIETLPDKSSARSYDIVRQDARNGGNSNNNNRSQPQPQVIGQAHIREYELPESSPLVQRHKQELRASARATNSPQQQQQQQRHQQRRPANITGGRDSATSRGDREEPTSQRQQSLASFLNANPAGSATPENKRRVRIVDPAAASTSTRDFGDADDYASNDYQQNDESALLNYSNNNKKHRATPTRINKREKVKYVNTNKFIYHQERNPDDEPLDGDLSGDDGANVRAVPARDGEQEEGDDDDDDDIDGVTRVEYYHTSWLDRQLGRASKRRSSKELNERQVKEKAMIEELKRSLKNGAITLRQSFKGKGKSANRPTTAKSDELFAEIDQYSPADNNSSAHNYYNNNNNISDQQQQQPTVKHYSGTSRPKRIKDSPSKVIASGLATIPKNKHHNTSSNKHNLQQTKASNTNLNYNKLTSQYGASEQYSQFDSVYRSEDYDPYNLQAPQKGSEQITTSGNYTRPAEPMQYRASPPVAASPHPAPNYSRTLPHKRANEQQQHQLLQSHYRGTLKAQPKSNTLLHAPAHSSPRPLPLLANQPINTQNSHISRAPSAANHQQQQQQQQYQPDLGNKMRQPVYNINNTNNSCSPAPRGGVQSPSQQQVQAATTISGMPSATEVVRSALSRSGSQISLNQLNKTINLLPNSPPPAGSPMTPTQHLKPATPSLSPSPTPAGGFRSPTQYSSKTLGHQHQTASQYQQQQQQQQQYLPGQVVLHGTRTVGRPPQATPTPKQPQQSQQQQQPVYANPHVSFMQHKMDQQMKQPNKNVASIREFNELDSLLRSLSPGQSTATSGGGGGGGGGRSSVQTHITPGFSSKPSQPTFGGYAPSANQQQTPNSGSDLYARVQRRPPVQQQVQPQQQQQQQQQRPVGAGFAPAASSGASQPGFTIDVTNKKFDENCRRREELSEFETPIELVPSMEDYQNIAKLNPVQNRYWYKPNMSRDMTISLLKDKPQGTFIVRDSNSFRGAYGLAVRVAKLPKNILANLRDNNDPSAEYIRHFLIEPTGSGVRLKGYANEPVFDSLADLIYQHSLTELALPCKLIIPRADIEDPRFNQKQKQFFDDFIASKEQAKHQPYERTSPDGGYRRYPGDVYVHNEHRIIFE